VRVAVGGSTTRLTSAPGVTVTEVEPEIPASIAVTVQKPTGPGV